MMFGMGISSRHFGSLIDTNVLPLISNVWPSLAMKPLEPNTDPLQFMSACSAI